MNFEEESFYDKSDITYYHPLCNLRLNNVIDPSRDRLLNRKESEIRILTYNILAQVCFQKLFGLFLTKAFMQLCC